MESVVLYIIIDKKLQGIVEYFKGLGIEVSGVFYSIDEARRVVLLQPKNSRLVIVDTGLGLFSNINARKDIMDIVGICDENNKITVFYTDTALKTDLNKESNKLNLDIDWHEYKNTAHIAAILLSYNEKYILDDMTFNIDDKDIDLYDILEMRLIMRGIGIDNDIIDIRLVDGIKS